MCTLAIDAHGRAARHMHTSGSSLSVLGLPSHADHPDAKMVFMNYMVTLQQLSSVYST